MGGPWRDRSYIPSVPVGARPAGTERAGLVIEVEGQREHRLLAAFLTGIAIGLVFGAVAFALALPHLPFEGLR